MPRKPVSFSKKVFTQPLPGKGLPCLGGSKIPHNYDGASLSERICPSCRRRIDAALRACGRLKWDAPVSENVNTNQ